MDFIHFETLGCKLNQIETESLAHAFSEAGFGIDHGDGGAGEDAGVAVEVASGADGEDLSEALYRTVGIEPATRHVELCVVNTCTVTGKAEQKARRLIRLLLRRYPAAPVLVTGCYAEVEGESIASIDPRVTAFPGTRKGELVDLPAWLVSRRLVHPEEPMALALSAFYAARREVGPELPSATFRLSTDDFFFHSRASIKIQDGCDNRCSYCRIRLARGKAVSLSPDEVLSRVKRIEDSGWGEVVLAGVNLSQYRSGGGDFADLLARILRETSRIAIRVSSLYPERIDEAILPMLAHARVRPHFHLSVQSGSDRILALMRRPYAAEAVVRAAERLRSIRENPFLACDIITGFPGETDGDFAETLALCERIGFAWIHAFPFSARPGTEAWDMRPRVPERVAGERLARLGELAAKGQREYADYWIGRELPAIVEGGKAAGIMVLTENYLTARIAQPIFHDGVLPERGVPLERGAQVRVVLEPNGRARLAP